MLGIHLSTQQILTNKYFVTCLSWKPPQKVVWLRSIKISLLLTQVVIGITSLKPFKVKIISVSLWGWRLEAFSHDLY